MSLTTLETHPLVGKFVRWIQGSNLKTGQPNELEGKVLAVIRIMESAWDLLEKMKLKRKASCCDRCYRGDRLIVETENGIKIVFSTNVYEIEN